MVIFSCKTTTTGPEPKPLLNTIWTLNLFNIDGEKTRPAGDDIYTIVFNNDSTCTGQNDCNEYFGKFKLADPLLTINITGTTKVYCGNTSKSWDFLNMLEEVTSCYVHQSELYLYKDSTPILTFTAE